ncbi:MAG: hypothetical protein ACYCUX_08310, partial [Metallibacterium sp.]
MGTTSGSQAFKVLGFFVSRVQRAPADLPWVAQNFNAGAHACGRHLPVQSPGIPTWLTQKLGLSSR